MGMLLGVPVFSVIYMLINRWIDSSLRKRDMPLDVKAYCAPNAPLLEGKPKTPRKKRPIAYTVKPLSVLKKKHGQPHEIHQEQTKEETESKQENDG